MANPHKAATAPSKVARLNPATTKVQLALERRARWTVNEMLRRRTYTYAGMIEAIRERFECGKITAQVTYSRARVIIAENANIDVSSLINALWTVHDRALHDKKYQAAIRAIDRMAALKGMLVKKHELEISGQVNVQHTAHLRVLAMTPIERNDRQRELEAKHQLEGMAEADLDATLDRVLAPVAPAMSEVIDVAIDSLGRIDEDDDAQDDDHDEDDA